MKKFLLILLALTLIALPALAEADVEADADVETEVEVEVEVDADAEAEVDADAEAEVDADAEAEVDADAEAEVDAEAEAEVDAEADAVTSASVADFYADGILTGDDLMNAINSYSGFYAVASVNPDGTPQLGFYIYGCVKVEETYYLQLGLSPNQTTANVENGSALYAMYAALPNEGENYPTSGARMNLAPVTDDALLAELMMSAPAGFTPMYYEVTSVRSLG